MSIPVFQTAEYFPNHKIRGVSAKRFSLDEDDQGRLLKHVRQDIVCSKWEHAGGKDLKPGEVGYVIRVLYCDFH